MESPKNNSSSPQTNEAADYEEIKKSSKKKISKNIIGRRFSDEQIKSLESIFKLQTKLEPKKRLQIARDLGLEPRQVAIWFQNKRARWKFKKIEQEYEALTENYQCLYMKFDYLKKEKHSLLMKLQELNELVKNLDKVDSTNEGDEFKEYPNSPNKGTDHNDVIKIDDDDKNITNDFEKTEGQELMSWSEEEEIISHLASPKKWCDFSSGGLFDQSSGTSNWWED